MKTLYETGTKMLLSLLLPISPLPAAAEIGR
jgi:hypothetical protein